MLGVYLWSIHLCKCYCHGINFTTREEILIKTSTLSEKKNLTFFLNQVLSLVRFPCVKQNTCPKRYRPWLPGQFDYGADKISDSSLTNEIPEPRTGDVPDRRKIEGGAIARCFSVIWKSISYHLKRAGNLNYTFLSTKCTLSSTSSCTIQCLD